MLNLIQKNNLFKHAGRLHGMPDQTFPEPTVGGLIFGPDGRLLLVKSHKFRGVWTIPGGHIELGERMEEALVREVKEETGLDVYGLQFLLHQEFVYDDVFWKKKHYIFFDFASFSSSRLL